MLTEEASTVAGSVASLNVEDDNNNNENMAAENNENIGSNINKNSNSRNVAEGRQASVQHFPVSTLFSIDLIHFRTF